MHDVTIIIPVYCTTEESLEWLGECLDSACSQDCEVVAVDDESPIDILGVIRAFEGRITFDKIPHIGVAGARNGAAARATSNLILPLDCDDRLALGAVSRLVSAWDGETPVYPDVRKFGLEDVPHYVLLDFSCDHIIKHVGFSSVNVLHLKDQWRNIGGWDETIPFYEDGEYNARLFAAYCGKHLREPLVEYRMHDSQRTKLYKSQSAAYARQILYRIRRLDMACKTCGRGRRTFGAAATTQQTLTMPASVNVNALPGEMDGRILAQYVGGQGRGKHYYNGLVTKFAYKVSYMDYIYADPRDIREIEETSSPKLLIRVRKPEPAALAPKPAPAVVQVAPQPAEEKPERKIIQRTPRSTEGIERQPVGQDLPDIGALSVNDVLGMEDLDPDTAKTLLAAEKRGKNRAKVVKFLIARTKQNAK